MSVPERADQPAAQFGQRHAGTARTGVQHFVANEETLARPGSECRRRPDPLRQVVRLHVRRELGEAEINAQITRRDPLLDGDEAGEHGN